MTPQPTKRLMWARYNKDNVIVENADGVPRLFHNQEDAMRLKFSYERVVRVEVVVKPV